jgi:NAD(P)-dependent dehydrogenase (short-subunit alcohol dehydrogenase family)
MEINNTIIAITGGASGLGAATAEYLIKQGARVALLDINKKTTEDTAQRLGCFGVECNVTSEVSVQNALNAIVTHYGCPRVCVNFAGILGAGKILGRDGVLALDYFKNVVDIDLNGTFNVMRLAAVAMSKLGVITETAERGVIINIASIAAFEGQIGQIAYSASKAGVVGMTLPAARELAEHGIRVACIAPGVFDTPMLEGAPDKVRNELLSNSVFPKRFGKPFELASFVAQIITNPMINGCVIRVDGAIRLPPR